MNAQGGSSGQANANNQNESSPHLSVETLDRLLPLFPLIADEEGFPQPQMNLPQQGANNNGVRTYPPFHESPYVVAPESNISSSSSLARTPPNRSENVDLSLNFGLSSQGATISPAVPSSNVPPRVHGSNSNSVNIPRKRNLPDRASGEFHQGESSNVRQETGEVKRLATEPQVRADNNVNPSPPSVPPVQQQRQPHRGRHVNPNNGGAPIPQPNRRANRMTNTNGRRGSHGPIPSQASFHFNGASTHSQFPLQPSHSVRPPSFHSRSFMSSPASSVNNITVRNAPPSISSPCPHSRVDVMIPSHEHGNNIFAPVAIPVGNFLTYPPPNRSHVDTDRETARRALSYVLPHQYEPSESETMQLVNGMAANMGRVRNAQPHSYHPLSDHASPSTWVPPQGPRGMHHSAAASSSGTRNHHALMQIPQFPPLETVRRLPSEISAREDVREVSAARVWELVPGHVVGSLIMQVQSLLHSLRHSQMEHFHIFESQPFTGLSLATITHYMERETFRVANGGDREEDNEKCPVCLEEFATGDDIGKLHSCVHKFHFDCIKEWLMQNNICPVCRRTALEMPNVEYTSG